MTWSAKTAARLENEYVRLRTVREEDREALRALALAPEIWRYFVTLITSDADFDAYFDSLLSRQDAGTHVVYVITDKRRGRVAGSMSYSNLAEEEARLEIGGSWVGLDFQGKGVNRWAKYLLLEQAFERLGAARVEFKTDVLNVQARRGLQKIGAVEEGVLRSYNYMPGGRRRDAVYYSVLREEWPEVRTRLTTS